MKNEQKSKLKKLLISMSDETELEALKTIETADVSTGIGELTSKIEALSGSSSKELQQIAESLSESVSKTKSDMDQLIRLFSESQKESTDEVVKALTDLGGTLTTSYEKNKPENAAGVYKDMINQISAVKESIDKKPVPVWNWPQYASISVRNKNFANINPATDGLGIGDYDYFSLVQTSTNDTYTYKQNGASGITVATVSIEYTSSAKTTISTVTKT